MGSVTDLSGMFTKLIGAITSLASAGPAGWIIGGIIALAIGGLAIYFWWKKKEIAHNQTQAGRINDQGATPGASQGPENNMNDGQEYVDSKKSTEVKPKRPT